MKIIIETSTGRVLGQTNDTSYTREGVALIDPVEGFDLNQADEWAWDGAQLAHDPVAAVNREKASRIAQIKRDAASQIDALAWRMERAQERELLGVAGEKVSDVLREREAIRRANNRVEAEINAALDIQSVQAVAFAVTEADHANSARISRVEFLNRFTDAEMQAFIAASKQSPALEAYFLKLQNAEGVILNDPVTMAGVGALEARGIIGAGRAEVIFSMV